MNVLLKIVFVFLATTLGVFGFNYNGTWFNTNKNSGVAKIVITSGMMQAYGKCHPQDCDWGKRVYIIARSGLLASWRQRGIGHKVILAEPAGINKIKAVIKYLYCDGRVDKTRVEYFKKLPILNIIDIPAKFVGNWVNSNANTRSNTKIKIYKQNGKVYVYAWGKCHPSDCNWGRVKANIASANRIKMVWNQGFVKIIMKITGLNYYNGKFHKLRIDSTSFFNDSRGVRRSVQYFKRN